MVFDTFTPSNIILPIGKSVKIYHLQILNNKRTFAFNSPVNWMSQVPEW